MRYFGRCPHRRLARTVSLLLVALVAACATPATGPPPAAPTAAPASGGAAPTRQAAPVPVPPPASPVSVAYPAAGMTMVGFHIAVEEGYTRAEGLDAEMVRIAGTPSAQAIVARQVDFGMSVGSLLAAHMRGAPIKNVFVQVDKALFYLFAQPTVTSVGDLVGKPVGIGALGDATHLGATAVLSTGGVDADRVTFVANLGGSQVLAALQAGAVAAAVTSPPFDMGAERLGFRNLGFLGDHLEYLTGGLATHEDTIRERPAIVKGAVRAELKAHRYLQQNREGTIAHMARFMEIGPEEAALSYERYLQHFTADGLSTPERLERILRTIQQEVGVDRAVPVDEAFELSFARQANAELDREGWRP
jgi:ABC-type nitrate/sulfonate/bicarbonate transport system substrate-binding protein